MQAIKIVGIPFGEAPKWVKKAWIGVVLPTENKVDESVGIVSGKIMPGGYCVPFRVAIAILASHRKKRAAQWWQNFYWIENLVFDEKVCNIVA